MNRPGPRFAIIGTAGFVARRHLEAMSAVGGTLVAACDVTDLVGILDTYFPSTVFFLDEGEFRAYLAAPQNRIDYLVVCTPSDLHEQHCALGLSLGADVIVEKPPVLDPAGLNRLAAQAQRAGKEIYPVFQLRYHPEICGFRDRMLDRPPGHRVAVEAAYVSRRGRWNQVSWKGNPQRSGGIIYNFGVHVFDTLAWTFGPAQGSLTASVNEANTRAEGVIEFEDARVHWLLSTEPEDLGEDYTGTTLRRFSVDGKVAAEYSANYSWLHRVWYEEAMAGRAERLTGFESGMRLTERVRATASSSPHRDASDVADEVAAREVQGSTAP